MERSNDKNKANQVLLKEKIKKTQEELELSLQTLKSLLRSRRKKYK